jgi:two-component system response regulator VicR
MSRRVLIIEDDTAIARLLRDNLVYQEFVVECANTATDAFNKIRSFKPELVLLDLMLPEGDGFEICRTLTAQREHPPIIILSARSGQDDKVLGLNLGADDYVTKPFAFEELLARVRAVMRRHESPVTVLQLGDVVVDFRARRATRLGHDIELTHRELEILHYLADRPGRTVTRDDLLQEVWGYRFPPLTRSVDISIARLRRKIEPDPQRPRYIRTLHGEGYSLTPD